MKHSSGLTFRFADNSSATLASGTLHELGYEAVEANGRRVSLLLDRSDLTSALEIAFAHGGELQVDAKREQSKISISYSLQETVHDYTDAATIPTYVVQGEELPYEEGR